MFVECTARVTAPSTVVKLRAPDSRAVRLSAGTMSGGTRSSMFCVSSAGGVGIGRNGKSLGGTGANLGSGVVEVRPSTAEEASVEPRRYDESTGALGMLGRKLAPELPLEPAAPLGERKLGATSAGSPLGGGGSPRKDGAPGTVLLAGGATAPEGGGV